MESYPRCITPGFIPFDPLELSEWTEGIVTRGPEGIERKYTKFYCAGVYGGIATGYAVGCCLRCFYCWSGTSRDFPEKHGSFYSPKEAFRRLNGTARRGRIHKLRLSGCEPTIGRNHLLGLLRLVEESDYPLFILETNGIAFGEDRNYVEMLSSFTKVHVRVSIKAGTPEGFQERTGAIARFYDLPFKALRNLLDFNISCHAAAMTDPRVMPRSERRRLIAHLRGVEEGIARNLEEEVVDPYSTSLLRLKMAGRDLRW
jgi:uncharacterized Fe-S cluster-containing radical SAM superfamily protein